MDGYPKFARTTMDVSSRKMLTWRKRTFGFKKKWKSHRLNEDFNEPSNGDFPMKVG